MWLDHHLDQLSRASRVSLALAVVAQLAGAQGRVSGTVFDSLRTMSPLRGATVVIVELPAFTTTTDARGRFEFEAAVPPGRYSITFMHPVLDSLLVAADAVSLEVSATGRTTARLATPAPRTFVTRVCRGAADATTGVMIGRVRNVDDSLGIPAATVHTEWAEFELGGGGIRRFARQTSAVANAGGLYVLCGVPADVTVEVRATRDSVSTGPIQTYLNGQLVQRRDFAIGAPGAVALVSGTVRAPGGRPADGALVGIFGTELSTKADEMGRFAMRGVPTGTQAFDGRLIGARPSTRVVDVPSSGAPDVEIALEKIVATLPTVSVLGKRRPRADVSGFAERQRAGHGAFMDEAEIEKHKDFDLESVLSRMPGLHSTWGFHGRYFITRGVGAHGCAPAYFLDGMIWFKADPAPGSDFQEISSFIRASDVRAIEVYVGLGTVPAQFDRAKGCGVVVIWTKR